MHSMTDSEYNINNSKSTSPQESVGLAVDSHQMTHTQMQHNELHTEEKEHFSDCCSGVEKCTENGSCSMNASVIFILSASQITMLTKPIKSTPLSVTSAHLSPFPKSLFRPPILS